MSLLVIAASHHRKSSFTARSSANRRTHSSLPAAHPKRITVRISLVSNWTPTAHGRIDPVRFARRIFVCVCMKFIQSLPEPRPGYRVLAVGPKRCQNFLSNHFANRKYMVSQVFSSFILRLHVLRLLLMPPYV